jgi:hypothetical protein
LLLLLLLLHGKCRMLLPDGFVQELVAKTVADASIK